MLGKNPEMLQFFVVATKLVSIIFNEAGLIKNSNLQLQPENASSQKI